MMGEQLVEAVAKIAALKAEVARLTEQLERYKEAMRSNMMTADAGYLKWFLRDTATALGLTGTAERILEAAREAHKDTERLDWLDGRPSQTVMVGSRVTRRIWTVMDWTGDTSLRASVDRDIAGVKANTPPAEPMSNEHETRQDKGL